MGGVVLQPCLYVYHKVTAVFRNSSIQMAGQLGIPSLQRRAGKPVTATSASHHPEKWMQMQSGAPAPEDGPGASPRGNKTGWETQPGSSFLLFLKSVRPEDPRPVLKMEEPGGGGGGGATARPSEDGEHITL